MDSPVVDKKLELEELVVGLRRVVEFPHGTELAKRPKGLQAVTDADGNTYIYDRSKISATDILRAAESGDLASILGRVGGDADVAPPAAQPATAAVEQPAEVPTPPSQPEETAPPEKEVEAPVAPVSSKSPSVGTGVGKLEPKPKKAKDKVHKSAAEVRAGQLLSYPPAKHAAMAGIQRLVANKQIQEAIAAADKAVASGKLTDDEVEHAVDRGLDSPLVADAGRLGLDQLLSLLPLASPAERKKVLRVLGDKMDLEMPNRMPVERKQIVRHLVGLGMLKDTD